MELINPTRRGLLKGFGLLIAAPAIIKVAGIMPIRALPLEAASPRILTYEAVEEMLDEMAAARLKNKFRIVVWPGLGNYWTEQYDKNLKQWNEAFNAEPAYLDPFTFPNPPIRIT